MPAISDQMLAAGSAVHTAALHGEPVTALTGADSGRQFTGVIEVEMDHELNSDLGVDPRPRRMVRFLASAAPRLGSQGVIQTSDGRRWKCVREPGIAFLTVDYELIEITAKDTV